MELKLSDLVIPWIKERNFPIDIHKSSSERGIWYIDLHDDKRKFKRAMAAIVDHTDPPYVVVLNSTMRPTSYFHPADPEFFQKIEEAIKHQMEIYVGQQNTAE